MFVECICRAITLILQFNNIYNSIYNAIEENFDYFIINYVMCFFDFYIRYFLMKRILYLRLSFLLDKCSGFASAQN